jgi:hypothetical protein
LNFKNFYKFKNKHNFLKVVLAGALAESFSISRLAKRGADTEAVALPDAGHYFDSFGLRGAQSGVFGLGGGPTYNHYHYGGGGSGGSNQQYYGEYYNSKK